MSKLPDDSFARRSGASHHLINQLTRAQRSFVRSIRNDTLSFQQILEKLKLEQRWVTFWLRNRTFRLALGKAMAERARTYDVENSLNAAVASRRMSRLLLDENPDVAIRACVAAFEIELCSHEIKTEKKRCRGVRLRRSAEQKARQKSAARRTTGPIVGPGSPVHPLWSEEEAEQMLAELEAPDDPAELRALAEGSPLPNGEGQGEGRSS